MGAAPTIGNLTISVSAPSAPIITSPGVDSFGTAPAYTAPTVTGDTQEITGAISAGTQADATDQLNFMHWYDVLADMIETEEDTELASAQIQKISSFLQAYSAAMQNQLNIFNDANVEYQATIQEKMKEADLTLQASIQDYTLELQRYQAVVNDEVQEYQQNLAGDLQVWQAERTTDLQKYTTDIQNELNEFNKENAAYQAQLQVSIQNAQLENQDEQFKIQKYQADYAGYTAEVNEQVQEYTQNLQADGIGYQWLQDQYNRLKAEYDAAFMIAAPKQQQGAK